jgi:hypothetical protein
LRFFLKWEQFAKSRFVILALEKFSKNQTTKNAQNPFNLEGEAVVRVVLWDPLKQLVLVLVEDEGTSTRHQAPG